MKRIPEIEAINPVPEASGETWARSSAGEAAYRVLLERAAAQVDVNGASARPRSVLRYVVPVAALGLIAVTAIVLTDRTGSDPGAIASCPVTQPPSVAFVAPDPYPAVPASSSFPEYVWYGTEDLWTVIATDGGYHERKSVWWSTAFRGGSVEGMPDIAVTARQLDGEGVITSDGPGTNAYTAVDGWFMIADFPFEFPPGCWEVTGSYKGAELSFTVAVPSSE